VLILQAMLGPTVGSGRRPQLGVMVSVAAIIVAAGCTHPHDIDIDCFRVTVVKAVDELVLTDPEAAAEVSSVLVTAEAVTRAELAAAPWRRDAHRVTAAWEYSMVTAAARIGTARRRHQMLLGHYQVSELEATQGLRRAQSMMRTPGMGRDEARAVAEATVCLAHARRYAELGDLDRAVLEARVATGHTLQVETRWQALLQRFEDPMLLRYWHQEQEATMRESRNNITAALVLDKLHRLLMLYYRGRIVATFPVDLGTNGLQQKLCHDDHATPEGRYRVIAKKAGAATRYYKALLLDYPTKDDQRRYAEARENGALPPGVGIGGAIEIHGNGGTGRDWTEGCVALSNAHMDLLFDNVTLGTPVTIVGAL